MLPVAVQRPEEGCPNQPHVVCNPWKNVSPSYSALRRKLRLVSPSRYPSRWSLYQCAYRRVRFREDPFLLIRIDFFSFPEEVYSSAALGERNASFFGGVEPTHPAIDVHADRPRPVRLLAAAPSRLVAAPGCFVKEGASPSPSTITF